MNCNARVDDQFTWNTFTAAFNSVDRFGLAGVGYVLTKDDGLTAVDLDHCRNPETGEIEKGALSIVLALCSYTEITPSETGLHILVHGSLPAGGRRLGNVEMYDDRRYVTVTGNHLDFTPTTVEERTMALHALHARTFPPACIVSPYDGPRAPVLDDDAKLLERAVNAKNGAKFDALYNGTYQHHSASEADLALCRMLAYWTDNDAPRIDRLFRSSRLMRAKWDELHGERTYGQRTIDKALSPL